MKLSMPEPKEHELDMFFHSGLCATTAVGGVCKAGDTRVLPATQAVLYVGIKMLKRNEGENQGMT